MIDLSREKLNKATWIFRMRNIDDCIWLKYKDLLFQNHDLVKSCSPLPAEIQNLVFVP